MGDQHVGQMRQYRDRDKRRRVETEFRIEALADDQRSLRGGEQRVTVRLRLGHHLRSQILRRARPILDDDRLSPLSVSFSPMMRGKVSAVAPGGSGTMILIGRLG